MLLGSPAVSKTNGYQHARDGQQSFWHNQTKHEWKVNRLAYLFLQINHINAIIKPMHAPATNECGVRPIHLICNMKYHQLAIVFNGVTWLLYCVVVYLHTFSMARWNDLRNQRDPKQLCWSICTSQGKQQAKHLFHNLLLHGECEKECAFRLLICTKLTYTNHPDAGVGVDNQHKQD